MSFVLRMALISTVILSVSCESETVPDTAEYDSEVGKILRGEHQLLPITQHKEISSGYSGKYFLIQSSLQKPDVFTVMFAWRVKSGLITYSEIPLKSVFVNYDDAAQAPSIRFRWKPGNCCNLDNMNSVLREFVLHTVITCNYDDWPTVLKYVAPKYEEQQDP